MLSTFYYTILQLISSCSLHCGKVEVVRRKTQENGTMQYCDIHISIHDTILFYHVIHYSGSPENKV